jgi:RNA polymerase sigma-70 factor (ECF subfamily)
MGLNLYKSFSEESLVEGCRRKNERAQRTFYEKFSPQMYPLCLRYLREVNAAEDVMISGFMKAFDKIHTYSGKGSLGAWVRRIMINQALEYLRKNRTMHLQLNVENVDYHPELSYAPEHLEAEDLMDMVCRLPLGYRTVFNLYAIEGYSHKEIGELLDISENTSKSQLSRARALLQKILLEEKKSIIPKVPNQ